MTVAETNFRRGWSIIKEEGKPLDNMKKCSRCQLEKELIDFGKKITNKDGHTDTCKSCRKEYYIKNKDERLRYEKEYRSNNLDKISNYKKHRRNTNELFRLRTNIGCLLSKTFKNRGVKKILKSELILGCKVSEFKTHIESQFEENMSWSNYGEWELDHRIPISSANTYDEVMNLSKYSNFQPLWKTENRMKSNKLNWEIPLAVKH